MLRTWITLFLPKNLPDDLSFRHYRFGYNETHTAVPLNYGSILNHHESANTRLTNMNFYVRGVFNVQIVTFLKICTCTHAHMQNRCTYTLKTFSRPQKTSRPDRKFFIGTAARSGLHKKTYRTPILTTQAQGGGQTSSRFHAAET